MILCVLVCLCVLLCNWCLCFDLFLIVLCMVNNIFLICVLCLNVVVYEFVFGVWFYGWLGELVLSGGFLCLFGIYVYVMAP